VTENDVGLALRRAGLSPRGLSGWAGTDRVAAVGLRARALGERYRAAPVPAAAALALFVGGAEIDERAGGTWLGPCIEHDLVERAGRSVRAKQAIVPLGGALLACDFPDAPDTAERVAWPDDSSHHLAAAIPGGEKRARWIDLGCGSAFAPLARPGLAEEIVGVELNPRAAAFARLGAALSGVAHLAVHEADVAHPVGTAALVTCNAPIPGDASAAMWRRADDGFGARLAAAARAALAPGGLFVAHATETLLCELLEDAPGERVIVLYAPGFGVGWWRPDAPARFVKAHRGLTADRPHVDAADRETALGA
jgi:hypothetical protein